MISFSKEEYKFLSVPVSQDSNYDELKALIVISRDIRVFCGDCSWVLSVVCQEKVFPLKWQQNYIKNNCDILLWTKPLLSVFKGRNSCRCIESMESLPVHRYSVVIFSYIGTLC